MSKEIDIIDCIIDKSKDVLAEKREVIEKLANDYFLARKIIFNEEGENDATIREIVFWEILVIYCCVNDFDVAEKEVKKRHYENLSAYAEQKCRRAVVSKIVSQVRKNVSLEIGELSRILGISEGFTKKIVKAINDNPTYTNKKIARWLVG